MQNTAALSAFDSQSIKGQWILRVADVAAIDTGILNSWKLHIGFSQDQSVMLNDPVSNKKFSIAVLLLIGMMSRDL